MFVEPGKWYVTNRLKVRGKKAVAFREQSGQQDRACGKGGVVIAENEEGGWSGGWCRDTRRMWDSVGCCSSSNSSSVLGTQPCSCTATWLARHCIARVSVLYSRISTCKIGCARGFRAAVVLLRQQTQTGSNQARCGCAACAVLCLLVHSPGGGCSQSAAASSNHPPTDRLHQHGHGQTGGLQHHPPPCCAGMAQHSLGCAHVLSRATHGGVLNIKHDMCACASHTCCSLHLCCRALA